jgi:mono/diheme cytochrome c family protein
MRAIFIAALAAGGLALFHPGVRAQNSRFRNAPESADAKNPVADQADAVHEGLEAYADHCANCHGFDRKGSGSIPALDKLSAVNDGQIFWFITNGDTADGMPSWSRLSEKQRWQIVAFLKSTGDAAK